MLDQDNYQQIDSTSPSSTEGLVEQTGESVLTIMWRFKWLLILFTTAGLGAGYWINERKDVTYQSTTQLMFRSDRPLILNSGTGMLEGGLPSGNIMQSVIKSDDIIQHVAESPELKKVEKIKGLTTSQKARLVAGGVRFQTLTTPADSRSRMIAALSFEGHDPELCVASVTALDKAIRAHFADERETQIDDLSKLIQETHGQMLPKFNELSNEYKRFQDSTPLKWDNNGNVINPYRERQLALENDLAELKNEAQVLERELKTAQLIRQQNEDPVMVAQMIGKFTGLDRSFMKLPNPTAQNNAIVANDLETQKIEIEKQLVPLETELDEAIVAFGENHPDVKTKRSRVENLRRRLNDLEKQRVARVAVLQKEVKEIDVNKLALEALQKEALAFTHSYIGGLQTKLNVQNESIELLSKDIKFQEGLADQLRKAESRDKEFRSNIEVQKNMLDQLYQRLAELDLADANRGIMVEPIHRTGNAIITGPDLKKDLVLFGMIGLGISGLLAMLFETSAKMFRSAEEIQRELRIPVLSHIPLDESRVAQGKTAMDNELAALDPKLCVVHRPYSAAAEAVRGIRTSLLFDRRAYNSKVFQITSPLPGDGKSTLVANIGCSLAQSGKKVLLIDLDLRSPRLSLRFNLESDTGLTNVLNGEMLAAEARHETPIENLDILPCGPLPANPAEALTIAELGDVFEWARSNYDFVIVDTPPLLMVSDPAVVTTYVDAAMLVMRIRRRCKPNAKESVAMLRSAGARVVGVVVNKIDEVSGGASYKASASGSYQSVGYGYGDKYRRRYQKEANTTDTYIVKGRTGEIEQANTGPPPMIDGAIEQTLADEPIQSS